MATEVSFTLPFEIPRTSGARWARKRYLESIAGQLGCFGRNGETVGLGFVWGTETALADKGLVKVGSVARSLLRSLVSSGIIAPAARTYFLRCQIVFLRDGNPNALVTLKED